VWRLTCYFLFLPDVTWEKVKKNKQRRLKSVNIESKSISRRQIHKIKTLQKTKNKITNKCHESDINKTQQ